MDSYFMVNWTAMFFVIFLFFFIIPAKYRLAHTICFAVLWRYEGQVSPEKEGHRKIKPYQAQNSCGFVCVGYGRGVRSG